MNLYKHIGKKALINKDGAVFGKRVTIVDIVDGESFLVSCDWYDSTKRAIFPAHYLTIQLPVNK